MLYDNRAENVVLRGDALAVAGDVECDIAYLDPPYNQHQYGANYHLLNTIVLWDKPPVSEHISGNGHKDKAAIRKDWRTARRSMYCHKSAALDELEGLLPKLRARHILLSYSTEGIIPVEALISLLGEWGEVSVVVRKYKRYRVSSQRPSPKQHTVEFVAIADTQGHRRQDCVCRAVDKIMEESEERRVFF